MHVCMYVWAMTRPDARSHVKSHSTSRAGLAPMGRSFAWVEAFFSTSAVPGQQRHGPNKVRHVAD